MSQQVQPIPSVTPFRHWIEGMVFLLRRAWEGTLNVFLWPFYLMYQSYLLAQAKSWNIPRHIGIIMDGNRRFARTQQFQNILDGHEKGAAKLEEVLNWCEELGVPVMTVWIFSMDNFNRDQREVDGLFSLFEKKFLELVDQPRVHHNQIRVRSLGQMDALPQSLQKAIRDAEEATSSYQRRVLNIGVAYGGREEIVNAFKQYLTDQVEQGHSLEEIHRGLTPADIEPYLYTSHVPDPDLIIRTSGEVRLSGFLLWQSVYSEYYFCDTHWPAFRKIDFLRALRDYHYRQRRFGR